MSYTPLFDPSTGAAADLDQRSLRLGDRTTSSVYVYDDDPTTQVRGQISLAVNAALATGRPILVSGDPGTGKSSLAAAVAEKLGWRYYRITVSSRTQAQDFLWTFDAVRRLADAQAGGAHIQPNAAYIEPGILWWAFDADLARRRGLDTPDAGGLGDLVYEPAVPRARDPSPREHARAVVLIDEIDKADPDVPNNLLEPLGSLQFALPEGRRVSAIHPPLVFITTNRERELPQAFLRRCLALELSAPPRERLHQIARAHYPDIDSTQLEEITATFEEIRADLERRKLPKPGTAEFLDAIAACRQLRLKVTDHEWRTRWKELSDVTLRKGPARSAP